MDEIPTIANGISFGVGRDRWSVGPYLRVYASLYTFRVSMTPGRISKTIFAASLKPDGNNLREAVVTACAPQATWEACKGVENLMILEPPTRRVSSTNLDMAIASPRTVRRIDDRG